MIENLQDRSRLASTERSASVQFVEKSIRRHEFDEYERDGWAVYKELKFSLKIRKAKTPAQLLKDSAWLLLYKLGFGVLSEGDKARISIGTGSDAELVGVDAVAIDAEVVILIESRTQERLDRRAELSAELSRLDEVRRKANESASRQYPVHARRVAVAAMVLENVSLSEADKALAAEKRICLLDGEELGYYRNLVAQVGEAARYQFLSDLIPGRKIPGLEVRVPAVRTKMAGHTCYVFPISPEYLAKISYISHRARNRGSDIAAYQRMISKARINKIREYIDDGGVFPTNIVVNLDSSTDVRFDRGAQTEGAEGGLFGWLTLKPAYRTAWIIDGQHRVFAYAGHQLASKAIVTVMAFEGLSASKQAELFIDINHKQKSVKRSLLEELWADLRKDADSEVERSKATLSRAVLVLDREPNSPFYGRVKREDDQRDPRRCITNTAMIDALDRKYMVSITTQGSNISRKGALWVGDAEDSLLRIRDVVSNWFSVVIGPVADWWDLGSADGGGLAMNNGVSICLDVLQSVFEFLEHSGRKLSDLPTPALCEEVRPFAEALGDHLGSFTMAERKAFRSLQGNAGMARGKKLCQAGVKDRLPDFTPEGLAEFLDLEKRETNKTAKQLIDEIEVCAQKVVVESLKGALGDEEEGWWFKGIPTKIREKVDLRRNEDSAMRGGREYYFDLIDYRDIVKYSELNWELFKSTFGRGNAQGKDKQTSWISELNEIRKIVAHASSGRTVGVEQLGSVQEIHEWFMARQSK